MKRLTQEEQTNLIEQALETRSWDMNKNKLAKSLCVRPAQAHMELLSTFYETRVSRYTEVPDLDKLERDITFARKDVERKTFHDDYYEHNEELIPELEEITEDPQAFNSYADIEDVQSVRGYDDEDVLSVVNNASELFQARTASFVQALLVYGEYETKRLLNLTDKQFNRKMNSTLKYIEKHHDKFEKVLGLEPQQQEEELEYDDPFYNDPKSTGLDDDLKDLFPLSESQKVRAVSMLYRLWCVK